MDFTVIEFLQNGDSTNLDIRVSTIWESNEMDFNELDFLQNGFQRNIFFTKSFSTKWIFDMVVYYHMDGTL